MNTLEHANTMAQMAVNILYSEGNPFKEPIDKSRLQWEIRQATLKKLVIEDSDVLDEEEFRACVDNSKIQTS
jgi:hypothetical protein